MFVFLILVGVWIKTVQLDIFKMSRHFFGKCLVEGVS